jgi:hypothetical protein
MPINTNIASLVSSANRTTPTSTNTAMQRLSSSLRVNQTSTSTDIPIPIKTVLEFLNEPVINFKMDITRGTRTQLIDRKNLLETQKVNAQQLSGKFQTADGGFSLMLTKLNLMIGYVNNPTLENANLYITEYNALGYILDITAFAGVKIFNDTFDIRFSRNLESTFFVYSNINFITINNDNINNLSIGAIDTLRNTIQEIIDDITNRLTKNREHEAYTQVIIYNSGENIASITNLIDSLILRHPNGNPQLDGNGNTIPDDSAFDNLKLGNRTLNNAGKLSELRNKISI